MPASKKGSDRETVQLRMLSEYANYLKQSSNASKQTIEEFQASVRMTGLAENCFHKLCWYDWIFVIFWCALNTAGFNESTALGMWMFPNIWKIIIWIIDNCWPCFSAFIPQWCKKFMLKRSDVFLRTILDIETALRQREAQAAEALRTMEKCFRGEISKNKKRQWVRECLHETLALLLTETVLYRTACARIVLLL